MEPVHSGNTSPVADSLHALAFEEQHAPGELEGTRPAATSSMLLHSAALDLRSASSTESQSVGRSPNPRRIADTVVPVVSSSPVPLRSAAWVPPLAPNAFAAATYSEREEAEEDETSERSFRLNGGSGERKVNPGPSKFISPRRSKIDSLATRATEGMRASERAQHAVEDAMRHAESVLESAAADNDEVPAPSARLRRESLLV